MPSHAGQVAFPGGRSQESDRDAARRLEGGEAAAFHFHNHPFPDTLGFQLSLADRVGNPVLVSRGDPDLADPGAGERAYAAGHLPGALYVHLERDLSGTKTGANGRHPLPDVVAFARRMFADRGWPVIDVPRRSIEETAAAVINIYNERHAGEHNARGNVNTFQAFHFVKIPSVASKHDVGPTAEAAIHLPPS